MIPKKSLDSVLDKSIIPTITAPNDNAKSISAQCAPPPLFFSHGVLTSMIKSEVILSDFGSYGKPKIANHKYYTQMFFMNAKIIDRSII